MDESRKSGPNSRTTALQHIIANPALEIGNLRAEYQEVCQSYRAIDDFRAKLLALLPLASGTGIYLLITQRDEALDYSHLGALGVFGFLVTLGLCLHEFGGIKRCWRLIELGKQLEQKMGLYEGQFTREHKYYDQTGVFRRSRRLI